jgi:hypothetical protein
MGAVKTHRRKIINWFDAGMFIGETQTEYDRRKKIEHRELQIYLTNGNNRRKMAGLPLIRRAKS